MPVKCKPTSAIDLKFTNIKTLYCILNFSFFNMFKFHVEKFLLALTFVLFCVRQRTSR